MVQGVLFALASYAIFSCADALIRSLGGRLPVFETGFFITFFALFAIPFVRPSHERWRDIFRMQRPWLVFIRAATGTTAGILAVIAFTALPLAEAYAIVFLAPLIATLLSIPLLGETIGWRRSLAMVVGFAGVLLVIRPGFRELVPGHLAALGVAFCAAGTVISLRALAPIEKRITLMGTVILASLLVNAVFMLFDFRIPSLADLARMALAGACAGTGHILFMAATRATTANRIAPAQYSQIVWAVLLGAIFFGEYPDGPAVAGIVLVALSGLFTFLREEKRSGGPWPGVWTSVFARIPPIRPKREAQRDTRSRP